MEAVPRLPMLSCELKVSTSNAEFGPALKKYIAEFYHENPESYNKEIKELEALRQCAIKVPRDFTGCRVLKRYFSQLQCLQNRFPMGEHGAASVDFMWNDLYSGLEYDIMDIQHEQACILYNIGALHSELGAADCRTNAEGMKVACTHFQCAAWAFQHLRDTPSYPTPRGSDTSRDLLTCFVTLMLAQAQECILEKSMLDSRKSTITAKVAAQVVDYYASALNTLQEGSSNVEAGCILDTVGSKIFKHWKKFMEFKMAYYSSISHLYMGNQAEEQQQMGERVAWYTAALNKHSEAVKIAKSLDREDLNEALTFTLDVIVGKCNAAKKENDFVYHEKVPSPETLPEVKGGSLVKGIPFDPTDPDICGPDIFVRLVPMEAHEAASVYSEEKAKILRTVSAKIDEKEQELVLYMGSLQLDRDTILPKKETLPQEIIEKCAALSVNPHAISDIKDSLKALCDVFNEVEVAVKDVRKILQLEEEREKEHQEVFGKRAPSLIITDLSKECSKYEEAHRRASESNLTLQRALELHLANLKLLISPLEELQRALPSASLPDSPEKMGIVHELQMLLDKVEEMRRQRHQLDHQLRDAIQADDITKLLVARDKNHDIQQLFSEQLKKHDQLMTYLDQNLSAQDNILRALTNANARFASFRKNILESKQRREMMVASLLNSYEAYEDLISKAQKGMDFYRKLQTNVLRLQARTKSVTSVQEEERQQIAQAHSRKVNKASAYTPSTAVAAAASFAAVPPVSGGGHKLKDFLPYMQSTRGKAPLPDPAYPAPDPTWSTPSIHRQNSLEPRPGPDPGNAQPIPDSVPMGVRPAPVGSEQVPTSSCTPYTTPAVSLSSYTHADLKSQHWAGQENVAYQPQGQRPYVTSEAGYSYPTDQYQYYSGNQVASGGQGYQSYAQNSSLPSAVYDQSASQTVTSSPAAPFNQYAYSSTAATSSRPPAVGNASSTSFPVSNSYAPYYQNVTASSSNVTNALSTAQAPSQTLPVTTPQSYVPSPSVTNVPSQVGGMQYYPQSSSYPGYQDPAYSQPTPASGYSQPTPAAAYSQTPTTTTTVTQASNIYSQYSTSGTDVTQQAYYQYPDAITTPISTTMQHGYYQYPSGSTTPDPSLSSQAGYSYLQQPAVTSTAAAYSMPTTTYSYSNVYQYPYNEIPPSVSDNQYSHTQYPAASSATATSVTYSAGNQSQYTPGLQPTQQTTTVSSYGDYSVMSPYSTGQIAPQPATPQGSYYTTPASQNATAYGPSTYVAQPVVPAVMPPTGYTDSVLKPTPSVTEVAPAAALVLKDVAEISPVVVPRQETRSPQSTTSSTNSSPAKSSSSLQNKDILDSLVTDSDPEALRPVLQPKVVTASEQSSTKEDPNNKRMVKDPFLDSSVLDKFVLEVERYKKVVEGLTKMSLIGQTPLDQKWKEVVESQDKDSKKTSISVARCYPMKNRFPEIMPYDSNRVELHSTRNDYINASLVSHLVPTSANYIVTQAPLPSTYSDFWTMVWEQQAEIIVCLLANAELKGHIYWPAERNQSLNFGPLTVNLHSVKETPSHTESMLNVTHNDSKISRVVIHLQYTAWPPGEVPTNPSTFLQFIAEVHNYHEQQRNLQRPIIIHCSGGVGRSGGFCLLSSAMKEVSQGRSPPDMAILAALASQQRKFLLQEREQLKFCYEAALYHAQDILVKRGILSNKSTFDDVLPTGGYRKTHSRHPSEDFILGGSTRQQANNENEEQVEPLINSEQPPKSPAKSEQATEQDQTEPPPEKEPSEPVPVPLEQALPPRQTSITSILDPANFSLDPVSSPGKQRFTKDSFKNPSGLTQTTKNSDPLSQLDPLWSLKKN